MWFFDKIISLTGSDPSSFDNEGFKVLVACVILVAAAALVIFPLMKIVRFIRTICRVFSGPQCDSHSKLTDEQLRVLTIGNLYAYQQGGWLNSLKLNIDTSGGGFTARRTPSARSNTYCRGLSPSPLRMCAMPTPSTIPPRLLAT